jgi:dihydroorotate dehydrogenase electron transfer subunit
MLATVAHLARQYNMPCQVSLEERMACGVGACHGCAVSAAERENAYPEYKLVCRDGPVFDMNEVCLK